MIQTQRLILRPFTEADAPAYHALVSDPEVLRYMGAIQTDVELFSAHWVTKCG